MNELPDIIFTASPSSGNVKRGSVITIDCRQFVELIKKDKVKILFSGYMPRDKKREYFLFFLKEGFIINTKSSDVKYLEKNFKIKKIDCNDFFEYLEVQYYKVNPPYYMNSSYSSWDIFRGDKAGEILRKFKESTYFGFDKENFDIYIKGKRHFFDEKREFEHAKQLGIKFKKGYDAFINSGYRKYNDYLEANEGCFEEKSDFYKAKELGIKTLKEYQNFLNKGFKDYLDKIREIDNDAEEAYNENRWGDYVRLKYLSYEKRAEILYYKVFDKEISQENDLNLSQIISTIEEKINKKFGINNDLYKWRLKRNEIIHEHIKVDKNMADKAKNFFDIYANRLDEEFNNYRP